MDLGIILLIVFLISFLFISFILLIIFATRNYQPLPRFEDSGERGERAVAELLERCALEDDKVINDVTLLNPQNGMTSQIDHILLSRRGIFVIETKNYAGKIYGNDTRRTWKQVYDNGMSRDFPSPVKQNFTHLHTVKSKLDPHLFLENIVIFVQGNISEIDSKYVYSLQSFESYLNGLKPNKLRKAEIDVYYNTLIYYKENPISQEKHLQNIRQQQQDIEMNICPHCKKKLVLRDGMYGKFYGCPNYPKCTFTKDL